jgi:hypothetical protein
MGLLDKVFGTQNKVQEVFSPAEAFAAIPPAPRSHLQIMHPMVIFPMMKLYRSYPNDVMCRIFDQLLGILRREGVLVLVNPVRS